MKRALVTGAAGGIGSAVVAALAGTYDVTAVVRPGGGLDRLAAAGVGVIAADLAEPARLAESIGDLSDLDALVHCAGVSPIGTVGESGPAVWRRTLTVNLAAAAELTRLTLPGLRRRHGHVVFVNASPGMRAVPGWSAFTGSKAATRELADSLREEEAAHGIKVTTVYPAATATELLRRVRAGFGRPFDPARCIQPASLAAMVAWVLAAPPDSYVCELSVLPCAHPS